MAALEERLSEQECRKDTREQEAMKKQKPVISEVKDIFTQTDINKFLQEKDELQERVERLQKERAALKAQCDTGGEMAKFLWENEELQRPMERLQNELQKKNEFQRRGDKLQNERQPFKDQGDMGAAMGKCLQEQNELQKRVEKLLNTVNKLQNEMKSLRDQSDIGAATRNYLREKAGLKITEHNLQNKTKGLEGKEALEIALEADFEQERVQKDKLEDIISKLVGEIKGLSEKMSKAEQDIIPPDVTDKICELENSLASERCKNKIKEEELNDLRQQVKTLQDKLQITCKMYEHDENKMKDMKIKLPGALATEAAMKKIKYLEDEIQHLNDKKKELAYELATKEENMSEICAQIEALKKEKNKLTDIHMHTLQGKMKIDL
jgi:chromosome segregation ATPase